MGEFESGEFGEFEPSEFENLNSPNPNTANPRTYRKAEDWWIQLGAAKPPAVEIYPGRFSVFHFPFSIFRFPFSGRRPFSARRGTAGKTGSRSRIRATDHFPDARFLPDEDPPAKRVPGRGSGRLAMFPYSGRPFFVRRGFASKMVSRPRISLREPT